MTNISALKCWIKIQHAIKRIITGWDRFNFPCDSHPKICWHCIRLRHWVSVGKLPNFIFINTVKGVYISATSKVEVTYIA